MTKKTDKNPTISSRERGILIVLTILMVVPIPFTYVFFLLPLLNLPVALFAILVVRDVIKNPLAVRVIQFLSILGALSSMFIGAALLNYLAS